MTLGYIGLGKMGLNMVERLLEKGHQVVATNRSEESIVEAETFGALGARSPQELIDMTRRATAEAAGTDLDATVVTLWLMVPWKAVDGVLDQYLPLLRAGDRIIDGGNSPYQETIKRATRIEEARLRFMDIGVSGGPGGARNGACMMVGGDRDMYDELVPLLTDLNCARRIWLHGCARCGALREDGPQWHRVRHDAGYRRRVWSDAPSERI